MIQTEERRYKPQENINNTAQELALWPTISVPKLKKLYVMMDFCGKIPAQIIWTK